MTWLHSLCLACWNAEHPDSEPVVWNAHPSAYAELCCKCDRVTRAGVSVRRDPATMLCGGKHAEEWGRPA